MIDIIVSVGDNNALNLQRTLNTIGDINANVIVVVPEELREHYMPEDVRALCPLIQNMSYIRSGDKIQHMKQFYDGLHSEFATGDIITFLKSGDYFLGAPHIERIQNIFDTSPNVMVLCGRVQTKTGISLYCNDKINLQGKFFKRQFIDYYTFFEEFVNELEFSLNLHYISEVQKNIIEYIDEVIVFVTSPLSDIGAACQHYFDQVVPYQDFFDNTLTIKYIYSIMAECYFSYIEAINLEVDAAVLETLLNDIYRFYLYFRQLELTDTEVLVEIYNQGILARYGVVRHPFVKNIPTLHLIQFLEMLEANVKSEE